MSLTLEELLKNIKQKIKDIPFSYVIEKTTNKKIYPFKPEENKEDEEVLKEIIKAAREVIEESQIEDFSDLRPNEISIRLEDMMREKLNGKIPQNKVSGYPNIEIERFGRTYYIEIKLAEVNQLNSSFRAFYYEPTELTKVTKDACHILIGFIHKNKTPIGFKIIDLSKIKVRLKNEFNANNKELYKPENILYEEEL